MKGIRMFRVAVLIVAPLLVLLLAAPAGAVITASHITTPAGPTFALYNRNSPNSFAIAGTTNSTSPGSDKVDIDCFFGDNNQFNPVASGVSLASNGSFSVAAASYVTVRYAECRLRAVPAGYTADNPAFAGPLMLVGERVLYSVSAGPNAATPYDYYIWNQQHTAADDYDSLGGCGLADSYLFDTSYGLPTQVFWCNAWLSNGNRDGSADTRSEIQVDGRDAYAPAGAQSVFSGSANSAGFPALTMSLNQNPNSGDLTITESERIVRCSSNAPFPPTKVACPSFAATGVAISRTIKQTADGHIVTVVDHWRSVDGHTHAIDLLYQNDQTLAAGNFGVQSEIGYRFPLHVGYLAHPAGDTLAVPRRPSTIYVKRLDAPDGDPSTGQGAITYSVAPSQILFISPSPSNHSDFTMHYAATVPASGALSYEFGYSFDFTTLAVTADALPLEDAFSSPSVSIKRPHNGANVAKAQITVAGTATDNVGVVSLTVGGTAVRVARGGAWHTQVTLHHGANTIKVRARDAAGNVTTATIKIRRTN